MKTVKYHLSLALVASILVGCDLFFPYTLEDAPEVQTTEVPEGAFSVSRSTYVYFSSGNLQYHAGMDKWRFAPNQYDYVGEGNSNISSSYNGWIDLFGWGTGDSPTKSSDYYDDYSMFIDWGANQISNDEEGTWRTLTSSEWEYILNKRKNASSLQGLARVADVNGFILLPDNWKRPSGVTFNSGFGSGFSQNIYSVSKWQLMEEAGAIFLPAAGYRSNEYRSWTSVTLIYDIGTDGYYWSSSNYGYDERYCLCFGSNQAYMGAEYCCYGCCVRLVR